MTLTPKLLRLIRRALRKGATPLATARKFGVSLLTIAAIVTGEPDWSERSQNETRHTSSHEQLRR